MFKKWPNILKCTKFPRQVNVLITAFVSLVRQGHPDNTCSTVIFMPCHLLKMCPHISYLKQ